MSYARLQSVLLGSAAAVAVLAAAQPGVADEIDELRAQIQQLQDKMSQLERTAARERRTVVPAAAVEAGTQPRSWKLPGTNTSMQIGGYAKLDLIYDINGRGGDFQSEARLPLDGTAASNLQNDFRLHANQSRLWVRTWTPTDWGELRTHFEGDFFGNAATGVGIFRMRHAYGELGPVLAGQTWSTFMILEGLPDTIDFGGPPGQIFVRQAMVRYTYSFGGGTTLQLAIEEPTTANVIPSQGLAVAGGVRANDPVPDFVAKVTHRFSGGQASFAAIARYLNVNDGGAAGLSDTAFAWGLHAGVGWRFNNGRTAIGGTVYGGKGIGRYSGQGGIAAVLNGASSVAADLDTVTSVAGQVWAQQKLTDTVRANVGYGQEWIDVVGANSNPLGGKNGIAAGTNQDLRRAWVNMIWSPVSSVDIGVEYMWSFRGALNGANGTGHRIQVGMLYRF